MPASIFWCIWNERNCRCFDGNPTPVHVLKAKCLLILFSWQSPTPVPSCEAFLECVSSLVIDYPLYISRHIFFPCNLLLHLRDAFELVYSYFNKETIKKNIKFSSLTKNKELAHCSINYSAYICNYGLHQ